MSKLLLDEPPLMVLPSLACLLGLNQALVLQQLHFRLLHSLYERKGPDRLLRRWVGCTLEQWHDEFPWWKNKKTVQRAFDQLIERGLVITYQFAKDTGFRMNWYTIDYEAFDRFTGTHLDKLSSCPPDKPRLQCQKTLFYTPHEDNLSSPPQEDKLSISRAPLFVPMPITPNCPSLEHPKLSTPLKRDVVVKEKKQNNNTLPLIEERQVHPDGVVVVSPEEIPTPRTEAYRLLRDYGVSPGDILPIIRLRSDHEIYRLVSYLDVLRAGGKKIKNPGGWLARMARKDRVQIPTAAEAAYQRRFLRRQTDGGEDTPEPDPAPVPEPEREPWEHVLAALPDDEQAALRAEAEQAARRLNPGANAPWIEAQTYVHLKRLVADGASAHRHPSAASTADVP